MKRGHTAIRACKGCGRRLPRQELLRFVLEPAAGLVSDPHKERKGRGVYCCDNELCRERLARHGKKAGKQRR